MKTTRSDILTGISAEIDATPKCFPFVIAKKIKEGEIWKVYVDLSKSDARGLDESLEGSAAWWPGPPNGVADVLSVVPDNEQINLRYAKVPPPSKGKPIWIYPASYLEALYNRWNNPAWSERCIAWLDRVNSVNAFDHTKVPRTNSFTWLRQRQADAFKLLGWEASFLWGPAGTGKTTTLGAMLAQYLIESPFSKVLLLSTTNTAVDMALIAVDRALGGIASLSETAAVRRTCFRIGNHFIASNYRRQEHLLPVVDKDLIRRLAELEALRPEPEIVQRYAQWKEGVERIRSETRRQAGRILDSCRLAAMTTTRAVFTFDELFSRRPYDLIVFDESSQVGIAHALALAPLAKRCLFAGDPKQLAPIVQSDNRLAKRWLGRSMYYHMKEHNSSICILNEQSRMVKPICRMISNVFYEGELVVASDCKNDPEWKERRELISVPPIGRKSVHLESIHEEGTWSKKYHGPIRYATAKFIGELVCSLTTHMDERDILVLTPFRAQGTLIRTFLRRAGCKKVTVSTVHRAQGSERHTVIFDPASGNSKFLKTEDAPGLINVALSRAQARLVIILSPGDRRNPLLDRIGNVIENGGQSRHAIPISSLVTQPNFPNDCLGRIVEIKDTIGQIVEAPNNGKNFVLLDFSNGRKRKFVTSVVVRRCTEKKLGSAPLP